MTKNRIIVCVSLAMALTTRLAAQDIHFSQYSEMPASINPALAGVTYNTRAIGNYKTQWAPVGNKYLTYGVSFEQTIKHKKLKNNYFAVVANIYKDVAGDSKLSTLNPNLGFTYLQRINKKMKFSGGLQSGLFYRTIDVNAFRYDRQYDGYSYNPNLSNGEANVPRSSITSFDIGGGINFNFVQNDKFMSAKNAAKFDFGLSAYHFGLVKNSFIQSDEKLQTRFCAYFNSDFNIPGSINAIMPTFLFMRQGTQSEFIAGALFKFIIGDPSTYTSLKKPRSVAVGGYYRYQDAIIPSVLFQYNRYALGLTYDINLSSLTPATNRVGGLELMIKYNVYPGYGVNLGRTDSKPSY